MPLVPVFRRGRPIWCSDLPLAELAAARFPKLVVSGGHSAGFDAICDDLAERIGASRVVEGAGHEIQFTAGHPSTRRSDGTLTSTWTRHTATFDAHVGACTCGWTGTDHIRPPKRAGPPPRTNGSTQATSPASGSAAASSYRAARSITSSICQTTRPEEPGRLFGRCGWFGANPA